MMNESILAWHFLADDGMLRGSRPAPADNVTLKHDGDLVMCESGLHASTRLIDALRYAPGALACRVVISGVIKYETDKMVASRRTILWRVDATNVLHEFACLLAEDALSLIDDPAPVHIAAIEAKRAWMRGEITNEQLDAARDAAWDAARDAAWDVARAAAWAAARDAARATARDAARDASRAEQNEQLTRMIEALLHED